MVRSGLVIACRLATSPTSTSPVLENPTTEGVVRPPSALGMTTGSPASRTLTTELVVPRSIPTAFAMKFSLTHLRSRLARPSGPREHHMDNDTELSLLLSRKDIRVLIVFSRNWAFAGALFRADRCREGSSPRPQRRQFTPMALAHRETEGLARPVTPDHPRGAILNDWGDALVE